MAIKGFKDIIDRKGYKVNSEDRKVFEKEISKSNFGLGCSDMIEFILFDSSENQLPQGDDGKLVRYIYLDDVNISDYFIISDNQFTKKKNGTPEFIVDIEKLIREAGYSNGIFKTQVTLLNRRVGTDAVDDDNNLWVHEISASRTEIRLLPNRAKRKNKDLEKRLSVFLDSGTFRDDVIYYINVFIENLDLEKILQDFLMSKGNESDGVEYINLIKTEFSIPSFEILINRIKTKFIESMNYYASNRNWSINDINYGNQTGDKSDCIDLSIAQLQQDAQQSLINCIDFYLPKRDIQKDNILSKEEQITMDKVSQILKSVTSNSSFTSTVPNKVGARVRGCTDPKAENYNSLAQDNDGSCLYKEVEEVVEEVPPTIKGCMDSGALNYNRNATEDNGTCKYKDRVDTIKKNYYVWSANASIKYKQNGNIKTVKGIEFDSFNITHDKNTFKFVGDVREVPKPTKTATTRMYSVRNTNNKPQILSPMGLIHEDYRNHYGPGADNRSMNQNRGNYGVGGFEENKFYQSRGREVIQVPLSVTYKDAVGNTKSSSNLLPGDTTTICAQKGSISKGPGIVCIELGTCVTQQPTPKPPVVIIKPTPPRPKPKPIPRPAPPKPRPKPIQISRGGSGSGSGGNNNNEFLNYDYGNDRGMGRNNGNGGEIVLRRGRNPRML